jgi:tetratricopeptide (TPR) repeat protein
MNGLPEESPEPSPHECLGDSPVESFDAPLGGPRSRRRSLRLLLIPAAVVLAGLLGLGRYGYALRVAPDRRFQAALGALAENDLDGVRAAAEALQDVDGYEPHRRLLTGMVLLRNERLYDAIVAFGFARDHPETRVWAYTLSGEALYKAKQFRDATRILTDAIRMDPQQTDAHRWLAATYYDIGAMNHAIAHLTIVAQQAPHDSRPHRLMGLIHKDYEEYRKAIEAYRECLRRTPHQAAKEEVLLELAACQVKQQQHDEALQTLRTCPSSPQSLWLQAECQRALGDKAAAHRLLDQALRREPTHLQAMYLKGTMELEAGQAAAAAQVLQKAVETYPKEWRPRYSLAMAYKRLGNDPLAAEHLQLVEQLRRLRDRFTELHNQAMQDPNSADLRYQLGVVARQLDKPLLATSWFEAALALQPDHPQALQELTSETPAVAGPEALQAGPNPSP